MAALSLADLASQIESVAASTPDTHANDVDRKRLLSACDQLRKKLETPFEFTLRTVFAVCFPPLSLAAVAAA